MKRMKMKQGKTILQTQIQTKSRLEQESKGREKKMKYTLVGRKTSECLEQHIHEKMQEYATQNPKTLPLPQEKNTKNSMQRKKATSKSKPLQHTTNKVNEPQTISKRHHEGHNHSISDVKGQTKTKRHKQSTTGSSNIFSHLGLRRGHTKSKKTKQYSSLSSKETHHSSQDMDWYQSYNKHEVENI